ncbi:MAG: signal peptide peptidase SppA [Candidatus Margulisbacteria bacterium]|nr:signal peptide peptidase SppA [Candidatus Margulisiibacteriota bacterium]
MIGGFGRSIAIYRLKGLYKKLGLEYQTFNQGKYKDAFDPARKSLSADQEEMVRGLLADLYRQMITDLALDRWVKLEAMKEIGDGMIFPAGLAKEMGLIDELGYYKDAHKLAAEIAGDSKDEAKIVEPNLIEPEEFFLARVFGVAVIEIDGEIVSGIGGENYIFGGRFVGAESVVEYIRQASDDIFVKAIILRINSPGGDAIASGEIYKALDYARKKEKVIIASIGDMGTSGGYYIACAADQIVADKASLTGSIGVIGRMMVIDELLGKLDVETEVIKEGAHSDMFSGLRKLTSAEVEAINRLQKESYDEFIAAVAKGRKMSEEAVREIAQGRLYTGTQASELKLVDKLGGFSEAIDLARTEADILGEPRLIFYHQPSPFFNFGQGVVESLGFKGFSFWDYFLKQPNPLLSN